MGFIEAIKTVFTKYADFSGRARRSEYWYFTLFNAAVNFLLGVLQQATGDGDFNIFGIISGLFALVVLVPSLALCWRRLHDIGKSGTSYLLILIPIVGVILILVWACRDSQPGENVYGPNPKESSGAYI